MDQRAWAGVIACLERTPAPQAQPPWGHVWVERGCCGPWLPVAGPLPSAAFIFSTKCLGTAAWPARGTAQQEQHEAGSFEIGWESRSGRAGWLATLQTIRPPRKFNNVSGHVHDIIHKQEEIATRGGCAMRDKPPSQLIKAGGGEGTTVILGLRGAGAKSVSSWGMEGVAPTFPSPKGVGNLGMVCVCSGLGAEGGGHARQNKQLP